MCLSFLEWVKVIFFKVKTDFVHFLGHQITAMNYGIGFLPALISTMAIHLMSSGDFD